MYDTWVYMYAENHDDCNACNLYSVYGHACMHAIMLGHSAYFWPVS